jgi:hypothetical protein
MMARFRLLARERWRRSLERDRKMERSLEGLSRRVWPWRLWLLVGLVAVLALLDHLSTYAVLELSGREDVFERGILAGWALRLGGFRMFFYVDIAAVALLSLLAVAVRHLYSRYGFAGFGRAAFVLLLAPYAIIALAAIYNNLTGV